MNTTISQILENHPKTAPAIGGETEKWMSFGKLCTFSKTIGAELNSFGFIKSDRVAIVLPNGPEVASAFVSLSRWVVTAPLNPNYTKDEFMFYFRDLRVTAVLLPEDYYGAAFLAAKDLEVVVIRLLKLSNIAGEFSLLLECSNKKRSNTADAKPTQPEDIAVLLHTSGTTSRPKIVPITHFNLIASARHISQSLLLDPNDRCLNVMPLFHIHGLVAALASSLYSGGQLFCTTGFDGLKFFRWLLEYKPTWYSAVPTMHQAILARAKHNSKVLGQINLRFIRSSSASLSPKIYDDLSRTFRTPIIEGYGMTEASHQISCNPLPPNSQRAGSVGIPSGPLVKIAHESKNRFVKGIGEVVISGPNVTSGYENNPEANLQNFFNESGRTWFRTGDQGQFDADGYLWITGRLKEIINRGGEKISPREVDEVLMEHPDVIQAIAFAKPHDKLGEQIVAAIVLSEDSKIGARELKEFAKLRLTSFKLPAEFFFLQEIPKNATGKLQRIGLYDKLFSKELK